MGYQILLLLAPLVTVPYVSRVLGPTGVGINTFTNSLIQYFVLFGSIGISLYGNREIAYVQDNVEKRSEKFWEIELLKLFTVSLAYILFFVFMFFYKRFELYMLYQSLFIIAAALDISWFYMGLEDFKKTVLRNVIVKVVSIVLIFIFVKNKNDIGIYILILSASQLLGNITLWPYLKKDIIWPGLKKINIQKHLRPALQMFIPQIAIQIYLVLNRTMLGQFISVQSSGIFQYSDQFIKMALAIVTATGPVLLPRVSNAFAKRNITQVRKYLVTGFEFVSCLAFPMVFGIMAVAQPFATWFMGSDFSEVGTLMMIESPIIIFIAWSGVIGQQFLIPVNRVREYTISVLIGVFVNIFFNFALIFKFGAIGVTVATVLSEFSVTLYQLIRVREDIHVFELLFKCWKYLFSSVIMYFIVAELVNILKFNIVNLTLVILIGAVSYILLNVILHSESFVLVRKMLLGKLR